MRPGTEVLLTPRLRLARMTEQFLEASLDRRTADAEGISGLHIPPEWFDDHDLVGFEGAHRALDALGDVTAAAVANGVRHCRGEGELDRRDVVLPPAPRLQFPSAHTAG